MNASELKQAARKFGADLVGIASAEAFAHLPERNRPETVSDRVKSVVVVGHRILRGALRGVEEGTNFGSTYQTYGFSWMEDLFLSRTVYHLTCFLEDAGVEAIPFLAHRNRTRLQGRRRSGRTRQHRQRRLFPDPAIRTSPAVRADPDRLRLRAGPSAADRPLPRMPRLP